MNNWYKYIKENYPQQYKRMQTWGRRNCSFSTCAPTGTVSLMANNCTGGIEPLFSPYYFRRKKVNPGEQGVRVDFVDQNGDSWTEYPVLHPYFKEWLIFMCEGTDDIIDNFTKEELKTWFEQSPWYGSTANDIDWVKRVEMQGIIQKYITHSISSTINLPSNVSEEEVSKIYMESWKKGLKGITVYRDGSRSGVLITEPKKETNKFGYLDAVKRPKELDGELHTVSIKGESYAVVVGMLDGNPYEVFAFRNGLNFQKGKGIIAKQKRGVYHFIPNDESQPGVANLQDAALHGDEQVLTRLISGMLRHGMNPHFICDQINKTPLEIVSFGKALTRVLKTYIKEEELKGKVKCSDCGSTNIRLEEGCSRCLDCGNSRC